MNFEEVLEDEVYQVQKSCIIGKPVDRDSGWWRDFRGRKTKSGYKCNNAHLRTSGTIATSFERSSLRLYVTTDENMTNGTQRFLQLFFDSESATSDEKLLTTKLSSARLLT